MTRGASRTITAHRERGGVRLAAYRTLVSILVFRGFKLAVDQHIQLRTARAPSETRDPDSDERILCVCGEWSVWRAARSVGR